jgi:2-keto-4-pentenoate hydratase
VTDTAAIAHSLRAAAETKTPIAPVRDALGNDLDAARRVQEANRDHWLAAGRRIAGRKIAVSSPQAQAALGAAAPAWGLLYADMLLPDGATVAADAVLHPKLEGEIAMILGRDLAMPQPTMADALAAVDWCLPAIEIAGSRIAGGAAKIVDLVADNANSGLVVLGSPAHRVDGLDLRRLSMRLIKNGTDIAAGTGAAVAGHPFAALAWLAGDCVALGQPLRAGELIMTGTFFAMQPAVAGDAFELDAGAFGRCEVRFT